MTGTPFDELMREVMAGSARFGHRQHVHLTWLAVRRYGPASAITLVSEGIQQTARYAGAPQKYHATVSRAWVELVGHHAVQPSPARTSPASSAAIQPCSTSACWPGSTGRPTLASQQARSGWVEPDLAPFPWLAAG